MSDFTPHPVSAGIMSWHEYNVAFDYVKKKKEVKFKNLRLLLKGEALLPYPKYPQMTADPNEKFQHVFKYMEDYLDTKQFVFAFESDSNVERIGSENSETDSEGYHSDESIEESNVEPVVLKYDTELILAFTFYDICINLVNGQDCEQRAACKHSRHIFPTNIEISKKLMAHTKAQIDAAFNLVITKPILNKKYLRVFQNHYEILMQ